MLIRVPLHVASNAHVERNLKGIKVEKMAESTDSVLLSLCLQDRNFEDIFNILLSDIISNVIELSDPRQVLRQFLSRVDKWHALLEKAATSGLTPEEHRGLYGEIFLLRKMLLALPDPEKPLTAWVGSDKAVRDFQYGVCALEVKTSQGNNHQRVHISSERQLDTTTVGHLYLFHLSLDTQQAAGESLNDLVDSVSSFLLYDFRLYSQFQFKLVQAGYLPAHRELYANKGYVIRTETFYSVEGAFPRIEENDLRHGVGDVKYSIIISDCESYQTNENSVYQILNQAW
ncbi:hypothetical protein GCM10023188_28100 [Pontibacter saemangeumensis]|uniref:PD-(D/E)XK family member n=1 Tax=Pontibacter saemangeumensis TaxID=1084525 RepID=A0ABP8LT00_9BACT